MSSAITIDELIDEFEFLGEWEEQCKYLIELGQELPELPAEDRHNGNLVRGCQSRVWFVPRLHAEEDGPRIEIHAKSDARLVDGLIVVLLALANHRRPQEILDADFAGAFARLGLESHLMPQRRNGLHAMVRRLREIAAAVGGVGETPQPPRPQQTLPPLPKPDPAFDAERIREQFPALQRPLDDGTPVTYLDTAASAQKPQVVIDKEDEVYQQYYANAYRGVYRYGDRVSSELEGARDKVRQWIGAEHREEIAFTSGTTAALNIIAQGWGGRNLNAGDEIVLSILEHHANFVPWQWVAQQTGAQLRFLPLTDDGGWDMSRLDEAFSSRTKVVAVAGMTNVFGAIAPLEQLAAMAKASGAVVVVDGAQSVPHLPTHVIRQDVDFLTFSGHKLYGPSGVGVLYGRRELLEQTNPLLFGGHMIERVEKERFTTAPLPAKFEAGTLPIAQAIALGAAVDWTARAGVDRIHDHELSLLAEAERRMREVPGLRIYGPRENKGAIISFTIDGASAQDLASLLDLKGVCVRHGHHCAMPLHDWLGVPATVRASFGPYNTPQDIDTLIEAIEFARQRLRLA